MPEAEHPQGAQVRPDPGRDDYGELIQFRGLAPGEPYFMIRGQDRVAGDAVRAWAALALVAGAPKAVAEQALRQADRLDAWPVKKVSDAGHIEPAEQKQLAYAFSRRAWNRRGDATDPRYALAEQRGRDGARGALWPRLDAVRAALTDEAAAARKQAEALAEAGERNQAFETLGRAGGLLRALQLLSAMAAELS